MAEPLIRPLAVRRNASYARELPVIDPETGLNFELTGCTVAMQVRMYGAQGGDPLIDLPTVTTPQTEGLIVGEGTVQVWIDQATLFLLPQGKAGATMRFAWDFKVTEPGGVAEIWMQGDFLVFHGSTDRLVLLTDESGDYLTTPAGGYLTAG